VAKYVTPVSSIETHPLRFGDMTDIFIFFCPTLNSNFIFLGQLDF